MAPEKRESPILGINQVVQFIDTSQHSDRHHLSTHRPPCLAVACAVALIGTLLASDLKETVNSAPLQRVQLVQVDRNINHATKLRRVTKKAFRGEDFFGSRSIENGIWQ